MDKSELRKLFDYDAELGRLRWRTRPSNCIHIGDLAGKARPSDNRVCVGVKGKLHYHYRLVWAWHHGAIDAGQQVNHIDNDPTNDRIENLDLRSHSGNNRHSRASKNASGYRGVSPNGIGWEAGVSINDQRISLGTYASAPEAAAAYEYVNEMLAEGQFIPAPYAKRLPPTPITLAARPGFQRVVQHLQQKGQQTCAP